MDIGLILFITFIVMFLTMILFGYRRGIENQDVRVNDSIDRINRAIDEYNKRGHK